MENRRNPDRPFCLLIHHKAIHRNWLPELKYLDEYENQVFDLPDNFYDDYSGRKAAAAQEMEILKDMDIMYDTKMLDMNGESRLKERYLSYIDRMNPDERRVYDDFYAPIIEEFYRKQPQGKELAEWKY